jgi:hypothetical protein
VTRKTNSRVAGFTFLFYIAVAFPSLVLLTRATNGDGIAAKLAQIAEHASDVRIAIVLSLVSSFCALVLAVTMYNITRDEDADIAMLGLTCRVGEGFVGAISILPILGLLWLATGSGQNAADSSGVTTLAALVLQVSDWTTPIAALFFGVGSTLFAYLLLRGRIVPVPLAWLGLLGSVLIVIALPLQLVGVVGGRFAQMMWYPLFPYEVILALWLIIKGAAMPTRRREGC